MSLIFLSHSSADNAHAIALRDWLVSEGWNDLFLDLDPERGIVAGERWERALNEAASRCEAVLFLVSRAWLASRWCLKELNLAHRLNKRLFGVLIEDIPVDELPADLTATWQVVHLAAGRDHQMFRAVLPVTGEELHVTFSTEGLARLRGGLRKAGLDAHFFVWPPEHDPKRPPYRGLRPLESEDAGIFFGRDAPIVTALDTLRGLSEAALPRLLVILGASGAGKSSFLRAGLIPRLQRDDRHFLPLPIIRPGRAVVSGDTGLVRALEEIISAHGPTRTRADMRRRVEGGAPALLALLQELAEKARPPALADEIAPKAPAFVLSIDQGEELFHAEGAEEAAPFLDILRELLLAKEPNIIALVTIRSDAYEPLQTTKALDEIRQTTLSLPPLPFGAYISVIEGPAARLKDNVRPLTIEPALTQALLADIEQGGAKDALPLLAFTLERLYQEHGGDGDLKLSEYEQLGGIKGSIEAAVERAFKAADGDPKIPEDRAARLALLRRGLIPWLAGIDVESGRPRRRVARLSEIPAEARPLISHLVEQRLLATDIAEDTAETTIEPAHEALLRQWGLLEGWLGEDFADLVAIESVNRAARDWAANARADAWLAHSGGRLEEAERVAGREDFARFLDPTERAYLAAAREEENARARRELRTRRYIRLGTAGAIIVLSVMGAFAGWNWMASEANFREAQRAEAHFRAEQSRRALAAGDATVALLLALEGIRDEKSDDETKRSRPLVPEARQALYDGWLKLRERRVLAGLTDRSSARPGPDARNRWERSTGEAFWVWSAVFSPEGGRILTTSSRYKTARLWDRDGKPLATLDGHTGGVRSAAFSPDGSRILTASHDRTARLWDRDGRPLATLEGHTGSVLSAVFSPHGSRILTRSKGGKPVRLWDRDGKPLAALEGHTGPVWSAAFSPDGSRILTTSKRDQAARLWDRDGKLLATLEGHTGPVWSAVFSPDGRHILTASKDNTARLWDPDGKPLAALEGHTDSVLSAVFSLDGRRILSASEDNTARLWDRDGKPLATLGHTPRVNSAVFSSDGDRILTVSYKTAQLWDRDGKPLAALVGHTAQVTSAVFSPDGHFILTTSEDNTARLWDRYGTPLAALEGHTGSVRSAVFSPDGHYILTASEDDTARLWDRDGKALTTLEGHAESISHMVFSRDGRRILTASYDKTARLWDGDGKPLATLEGHTGLVRSTEFSPDGRQILTASSDDKTARLWDGEGKLLATLEGHTGGVTGALFSPVGSRILTASSDDRTMRLWDRDGNPLATLKGHTGVLSAAFSADGSRILTSSFGVPDEPARLWDRDGKPLAALVHTSGVRSAGFSTDGSRILTVSDKTARLWDRDGKPLATLVGHASGIGSAVFSGDGGRILTAPSDDSTARLWDRDGKPLATLVGHTSGVLSAVFSPDGHHILTTSWDKTARLWDRDGKPVATLEAHTGWLDTAVFLPDGRRILTASSHDHTVRLWDRDGEPRGTIEEHVFGFGGMVFSPDGSHILTASSNDMAARLWDRDGKLLATLEGHTGGVTGAVFSPDGRRILTSSNDKTARLWEVFADTQGLVDRAKADVPRCLTREQRRSFHLSERPPTWCESMAKWPFAAMSAAVEGARSPAEGE